MNDTTVLSTDSTWLREYKRHVQERADRAGESMRRLTTELADLRVLRVSAEYDGYGDSGQIEEVGFFGEGDAVIEVGAPIADAVEQLLYDLLEVRHGGWENNDGAFGTFEWQIASGGLTHEHNARFTDHDTTMHEGFGELSAGEGA